MIPIVLLLGMVLAVPLAWLLGMFNPFGYLGTPPWRVPRSARVRCERHGRRNCFCQPRLRR